MPASTIGAVLRRARVPHLAHLDRLTGELVRGRRHSDLRYEHDRPGSLIHVDVDKLGKIPPGGGWRVHGRREEVRGRGIGWDYVHVAVDDRSRLAYAEVLPDERAGTCAQFLHRACQWLHDQHGVTVRRVLTDNAESYRIGTDWAAVCLRAADRSRTGGASVRSPGSASRGCHGCTPAGPPSSGSSRTTPPCSPTTSVRAKYARGWAHRRAGIVGKAGHATSNAILDVLASVRDEQPLAR